MCLAAGVFWRRGEVRYGACDGVVAEYGGRYMAGNMTTLAVLLGPSELAFG